MDVFAWFNKDMPGIDWDITEHKIPLYRDVKLIKQKLRRVKRKWAWKIKEEV